MPVDEFCNKYGISLKLVMHRMNVLYWEDFDSLVVPQVLGDTSADKVRRTLQLLDLGWDQKDIQSRMNLTPEMIQNIAGLDDYQKRMFLDMDNFFFLNPSKIDLSKIFVDTNERVIG